VKGLIRFREEEEEEEEQQQCSYITFCCKRQVNVNFWFRAGQERRSPGRKSRVRLKTAFEEFPLIFESIVDRFAFKSCFWVILNI